MRHDFLKQANLIRRRSLQMVNRAGLGHPGGDLSSADILGVLYFGVLFLERALQELEAAAS